MGKADSGGETVKPGLETATNAPWLSQLAGFARIETTAKLISVSGFNWVSLPLKPSKSFYRQELDGEFPSFTGSPCLAAPPVSLGQPNAAALFGCAAVQKAERRNFW